MAGDDTIYVSKLDGTERDVFIRVTGGLFDGMVLDVRRDRSLSQSLNTLYSTWAGVRCGEGTDPSSNLDPPMDRGGGKLKGS